MADIEIGNEALGLIVTTTGGSIWRFLSRSGGVEMPLFREPQQGPERAALKSGCFPLVPFGNRVRDSRFSFEGREHSLEPNMDWDKHYLHGDGWTGEWRLASHAKGEIVLSLGHRGTGTPYAYDAQQRFTLAGPTLTTTLSVTNRGEFALPFGLGWHPYFPLTKETTLKAAARSYWEEDSSWLPTVEHPVAGDIDFSQPRGLPRRWVNTVFEDWNGGAKIDWPENGISLAIDADSLFSRYLVFVSDPAFDAGYDYDFFCFEPMSHSADGHNMPSRGGLVRLAPGESLAGSVRYTCHRP
ncbi:aldose 1-epimerase [Mesorhizobium ventifaucium]|uniref:Aldose 1-epimerase YphB n=1 Tax=Mesorhizobium ventifaucium TaxID=666020 RepID=A0ABN8JST1_9HYPH|nr:aldose 1-epimerase [Mesorhizobium ventifaucium]CAH2400584.1 putative aldose 1-epimerase YphB [Mesorhizobium ventifaucium]